MTDEDKLFAAVDEAIPVSARDKAELRRLDKQAANYAYDLGDGEQARTNHEDQTDVEPLSLRSFLRRLVLFCVIISIGGLYTQWIYLLDRDEKFRFVLSNTWPLLICAGMLFGLCIEQAMRCVGDQALALWQWWRFNMLFSRWRAWRRAPKWQHTYCCCWRCKHNKRGLTRHFNHCCCARCKFKRHWTYWKRFERYPKGWKKHK